MQHNCQLGDYEDLVLQNWAWRWVCFFGERMTIIEIPYRERGTHALTKDVMITAYSHVGFRYVNKNWVSCIPSVPK